MADIDLATITPEQFAALVSETPKDELLATVRALGTEPVLDRVFAGMAERFVPERASGVNAVVQFLVNDGEEHPYVLRIADGTAAVERGKAADETVTLAMDLPTFLELVAGKAQGPMLFMAGRLRVSGDVMFASRLMSFFDTPKA